MTENYLGPLKEEILLTDYKDEEGVTRLRWEVKFTAEIGVLIDIGNPGKPGEEPEWGDDPPEINPYYREQVQYAMDSYMAPKAKKTHEAVLAELERVKKLLQEATPGD